MITLLGAIGCFSAKRAARKQFDAAYSLKPFDAIIVPGVPFKNGHWDSVMKARVMWSYILYKDGYVRNVIYSGSAVYSPYYEALIMGLYGMQLGIPQAHIFYDTQARHSTENVYYSYLLAGKHDFKSIALATDPFQSYVLRNFTRRRFASPIFHLPFIKDSVQLYNYLNPTIDPTNAKAPDGFIALPEKESFWQRLSGTFGHHINWDQYPDGKVGPL